MKDRFALSSLALCFAFAAASVAQAQNRTLDDFSTGPYKKTSYGGLVQGPEGNFYGTASAGGNGGAICNGNLGCGVVFKLTPGGQYTVLHTFNGVFATPPDGGVPTSRLILASNGKLYGTTYSGCLNNQGTIFSGAISGGFAPVYMFDNIHGTTDGANPGQRRSFYGTTKFGGPSNAGTIFKFKGVKGQSTALIPRATWTNFPRRSQPLSGLSAGERRKSLRRDIGRGNSRHVLSGFLLKAGVFTSLDFPQTLYSSAWGINDTGVIAGIYKDASGLQHGFPYQLEPSPKSMS